MLLLILANFERLFKRDGDDIGQRNRDSRKNYHEMK